MCMNTILTYLKRGKKALLMLAVKLRADAAESDLPSLVQEHNTLQATLPDNDTNCGDTCKERFKGILFLFHQSHK